MPIYEFLCRDCNTLLNFFSARIDTTTSPPCPRCGSEIERRPAPFATLKHGGDSDEPLVEGLDDDKLEGVMGSLMDEMESVGESDDPRQLARVFRRFGDSAGLGFGSRMEEMLARLEAGEDPDAVEAEMGDDLEGDDSLDDLFEIKKRMAQRRTRRPDTDDTLYFL